MVEPMADIPERRHQKSVSDVDVPDKRQTWRSDKGVKSKKTNKKKKTTKGEDNHE